MRSTRQLFAKVAVLLSFVFVCSGTGSGYSVLTHEEMIDLVWKDQFRPLLLNRFPEATDEDLKQAHAYAYGGSVIQDMGYYPFGSKYFSDLVHYVRRVISYRLPSESRLTSMSTPSHWKRSHTTLPTIAAIPRSIRQSR